ncbi:TPA: DoxX family protein [Candidatus Woesearchaeota archaeon]|nr:LuxR family transcriptional regulator [archaeon]HIJ11128.1 DoxX family protein [Candidatus Woesearchaeota archaeon]|tara:strand:- start:174 stop:554 length:381 start_codon:yes stop_codon:yes gene_type:complete
MTIGKFTKQYESGIYVFLRLVVGLFFFLHGYGKFTTGAEGLFLAAGYVEVVVGALIFLGLFTRLGGLAGAVTMLVAFFSVHAKDGLNPMTNGGEMAVIYFLLFLVIMVHGNGMWSLEKKLMNKETF